MPTQEPQRRVAKVLHKSIVTVLYLKEHENFLLYSVLLLTLFLLLLDWASWHCKVSLKWLFIYDTLKLTNGGVLACFLEQAQTCIQPSWCHCHSVSCYSKIRIGFTFLVPAHPGSPGKGPLNTCVKLTNSHYITVSHSLHLTAWLPGLSAPASPLGFPHAEETSGCLQSYLANCTTKFLQLAADTGWGQMTYKIHCVSKKTIHQTLAHNFPKC